VPDLLNCVACGALIGDKGYDADALIERLRQVGVDVVIPPTTPSDAPATTFFTKSAI
jgi:hypothetical protein